MDDLKFCTRLSKVTLKNFKNIEYGTIDLPNASYEDYVIDGKSSILGIYGQNGSGKSAFIKAIKVLCSQLSGDGLESDSIIKSGCDYAELLFEFSSYDNRGNVFNILYGFKCFSKIVELKKTSCRFARIADETIEYSGVLQSGEKIRKKVLFSTKEEFCGKGEKAFGTKSNTIIDKGYSKIVNREDNDFINCTGSDWFLQKKNVGGSFFFNKDVRGKILVGLENCWDKYCYMVLMDFPNHCFIIGTRAMGSVTHNELPLYLPQNIIKKMRRIMKRRIMQGEGESIILSRDSILLNIKTGIIDDLLGGEVKGAYLRCVEKSIKQISSIIGTIVPGLEIVVDNGQLFSVRNGIKLSLGLESDGVKRLISIAATLSAAFNNPTALTIVDELDSGIFEDLLGNLLRVFSESAKGQLIFTSHNLRPLEVLPTDCIRFTTTNPRNRFFKMTIKGNSNLRDSYRRALHVGGLKEQLYNDPDNTEIKLAFMQDWEE